jgi:hypothetical protein
LPGIAFDRARDGRELRPRAGLAQERHVALLAEIGVHIDDRPAAQRAEIDRQVVRSRTAR